MAVFLKAKEHARLFPFFATSHLTNPLELVSPLRRVEVDRLR
jgi:hypothetical protein